MICPGCSCVSHTYGGFYFVLVAFVLRKAPTGRKVTSFFLEGNILFMLYMIYIWLRTAPSVPQLVRVAVRLSVWPSVRASVCSSARPRSQKLRA